jgi:hypothetical protein
MPIKQPHLAAIVLALTAVSPSLLAQSGVMYSSEGPSLIIPNEPFQAERVTRTVQHIDDGSILQIEEHELISRDAEGRLLVDSFRTSDPAKHFYILADPQKYQEISWSTLSNIGRSNRIVDSIHLQVVALLQDRNDRVNAGNKKNTVTQDLGTKMLDGVQTSGTLAVTTIPAETIGNVVSLKLTHEVWTSTDLQLVRAETDSSPISGTRTVTTTLLSRTPPPPSQFEVPPNITFKRFDIPDHLPPPPL